MAIYEYKVVPAPARGEKTRGVKGAEGRFAFAIERLMNEMAAEGWEYQRAETLPSEERSGLTSSQTVWRNLLVFRRARAAGANGSEEAPELADRRIAAAPELVEPEDATAPAIEDPVPVNETPPSDVELPEEEDRPKRDSLRYDSDNGVEGTAPLDGPSSVLTDRAARLRQGSAAE
ncbi:DUF4177 domain-containing protein [Salipiger abyssi]|uniref:DUF4177 domain-containing protein n=1 Tax=Salipiger abyssi TaxID=1250539 RepID=A0A1P8UWW0_9RHOB|nr:DUF4177 domain-containing protein [Salipiger abyssi]APZ53878.1 hypothetical protein Ga0080574_TMP3544 [Salipiger abyssi]